MKFTYIGCEGAPEVSTHYGVEFTIGVPAEVTDEFAIAKLSGHPHFVGEDMELERAPGVGLEAIEVTEEDHRNALAEMYFEKFGRKPHHMMKIETIREKLNADND